MKESFFVFPFLTGNTLEFPLVFPIPTGNIPEFLLVFPIPTGNTPEFLLVFPMLTGNTNGLASGFIYRPFYFATQAFKPWMTADENPACSIAFNPRMV